MLKTIIIIVSSVLASFSASAKEFRSIEKQKDNSLKVELVFEKILDVNVANEIIKELKSLDKVTDVELFYPSTNNGYMFISDIVSAETVILKLHEIGVELNAKSFKN